MEAPAVPALVRSATDDDSELTANLITVRLAVYRRRENIELGIQRADHDT